MTIVFVNRFAHPDHSATSQVLSDLAAVMVERGLPVAMVASRQRYDDPAARLPARESWRGVEIHRIWTSQFGRGHLIGRALDYLTFYLSLPAALWRVLGSGDVVVAKTDPPLVGLLVAVVAKLRGASLVNWLQDVFPEVAVSLGQPRLPKAMVRVLKWLRNRTLRQASMNVVIGSRMGEYLVSQGVDKSRVRVIPNWAHEEVIQPMPTGSSNLRRRQGLLQDDFVVAYSGNLGRAHDINTLYDAAEQLRTHADVVFLVIGGGYGYQRLRVRAEAAGLHTMRFLPYQKLGDLSDSMAAADLHLVSLLPELEGLIVPSKFYGIAAASRAVGFIGDPDGELSRLIAEGECGFSISPGRGDLLAGAIEDLKSDPERCRDSGVRARVMLDRKLSRNSAHADWHGVLLWIVQNGYNR